MSVESPSESEENAEITHDDLIRYMSLDETLDESIIDEINRHRNISGNPIAKWCDEMERKAADPHNVDWLGIMDAPEHEEEKLSAFETAQREKKTVDITDFRDSLIDVMTASKEDNESIDDSKLPTGKNAPVVNIQTEQLNSIVESEKLGSLQEPSPGLIPSVISSSSLQNLPATNVEFSAVRLRTQKKLVVATVMLAVTVITLAIILLMKHNEAEVHLEKLRRVNDVIESRYAASGRSLLAVLPNPGKVTFTGKGDNKGVEKDTGGLTLIEIPGEPEFPIEFSYLTFDDYCVPKPWTTYDPRRTKEINQEIEKQMNEWSNQTLKNGYLAGPPPLIQYFDVANRRTGDGESTQLRFIFLINEGFCGELYFRQRSKGRPMSFWSVMLEATSNSDGTTDQRVLD